MSQENVEIVRRIVAAWNAGDMDLVRDLHDPDVTMRMAAGCPVRLAVEIRISGEGMETFELSAERAPVLRPGALASRRWRASYAAALAAVALIVGLGSSGPATLPTASSNATLALRALAPSLGAAASETIGARSTAYRMAPVGDGGYAADNPAQRLTERFTRSSAAIGAGAGTVSVRLAAIGRGGRLQALAATAPHALANRVTYARPGVSEWYANGPLGLEQGFAVGSPARATGRGPLTLELAVKGAPVALAGARAARLGAGLRYRGLFATDARGRALPARLALARRGGVLLVIDDRGARYPVTVDPFFEQGAPLSGQGQPSQFGAAVALSADGSTALIGAPYEVGPDQQQGQGITEGAAFVFTRSGEAWSFQQGLLGTHSLWGCRAETLCGSNFGNSVSLSADGNTALVAGDFWDGSSPGAVWFFTRSGGTWTQDGEKVTPAGSLGMYPSFGASVALSGDGNTALVGSAIHQSVFGDNHGVGAAYVFARSGDTWTQQAKLTGAGESGEGWFGSSVALSYGGETALIGGAGDAGGDGAAWAFARSGETWSQQGAKITPDDESGAGQFGWSVALSADGNTGLIGGSADNSGAGGAWAFTRGGKTWSQQGGKLTGAGFSGETRLGESVALSSDGDTALIGGPQAHATGLSGAAWVFTRSSEVWSQRQVLTGEVESGTQRYGLSVALSSEAGTALVGSAGGAAQPLVVRASIAPAVTTGEASAVTPASATIAGVVNPEGENVTECRVEYGITTSYGSQVPCASPPGFSTHPTPVSAALVGLSAKTTYHYRLAATNATGTSYGVDASFTTEGAPEFGRCIKVAKGTGRFGTVACTTSGGTGSYEWFPASGGPKPLERARFSTVIKPTTELKLETHAKAVIACKGESGGGEYSGPRNVEGVSLTLTGCHSVTLGSCHGTGAAEGELQSAPLQGELGVITVSKEGPAKNKIGLDLFPSGRTGAAFEFTCGTTTIAVRGSVIVPVTANVMQLSVTRAFAEAKGAQKPEAFTGEPKDFLEASLGGSSYESVGLSLKAVQTNEEKVEINSVV